MIPKSLKIFNLDYSGTFKEVKTDNQLELFTLYNILAIYDTFKKIMYIWKGKYVSNSLKIYISKIREIFTNSYPYLKVLRNITFEYGSENQDFMMLFDFSKEGLEAHISGQEEKVQPYLVKIADLEEKIDNSTQLKDYKKALAYSDEIIRLAKEIEDRGLMRDQENLQLRLKDLLRIKRIDTISEIDDLRIIEMNHYRLGKIYETIETARQIIKLAKTVKLEDIVKEQEDFLARLMGQFNVKFSVSEIKNASEETRTQFDRLIEQNYIAKAHSLVLAFKEKYGESFDLTGIPAVAYFISKDEDLWKRDLNESEKVKKMLDQIEKELLKSIDSGNLKIAKKQMEQAQELLDDQKDDKLNAKWNGIKKSFMDEELSAKANLEALQKEIEQNLSECENYAQEGQFDLALEKLDLAKEKLEPYELPELHTKIKERRKELQDRKEKISSLRHKVEETLSECQNLARESEYDEAIDMLDSCLEEINLYNLPDAKIKIVEYRNELINKRSQINKLIVKIQKSLIDSQRLANESRFEEAIENISTILEQLQLYDLTELKGNIRDKLTEIKGMQEGIASLEEKMESSMKESKQLIEDFQFDKASKILESCLKELEFHSVPELKSKLEALRDENLNKKQEYEKIREEIRILETGFQESRESKDLETALKFEQQVVDISQILREKHMESEFSEVINRIQEEIDQVKSFDKEQKSKDEQTNNFKDQVKILNKEGLEFVEKGEFSNSLEKYRKILDVFSKFKNQI